LSNSGEVKLISPKAMLSKGGRIVPFVSLKGTPKGTVAAEDSERVTLDVDIAAMEPPITKAAAT